MKRSKIKEKYLQKINNNLNNSESNNINNSNNSDLTVMSAVLDDSASYGRIIRENDNSLKAIVEAKDATPEQRAVKEVNVGVYCLNG